MVKNGTDQISFTVTLKKVTIYHTIGFVVAQGHKRMAVT